MLFGVDNIRDRITHLNWTRNLWSACRHNIRRYQHESMDHYVYAPCQWETALHCNAVSHWLGADTEWSLHDYGKWHKLLDSVVVSFHKKEAVFVESGTYWYANICKKARNMYNVFPQIWTCFVLLWFEFSLTDIPMWFFTHIPHDCITVIGGNVMIA